MALLVLADVGALVLSFAGAVAVRLKVLPALSPAFSPGLPGELAQRLWWVSLLVVLCIAYEGLYTARRPFWMECASLLRCVSLAFVLTLAIVSLAKLGSGVSRAVLVLTWLTALVLVPALRYLTKHVLARAGLWRRRLLILGAGETGKLVARALTRDTYLGYEIVGFLDDDPAKKKGLVVEGRRYPVLGGFRDSDRVMAATGVRHLLVAAPGMQGKALVGLVNRLQQRAASVAVVPDLFGVPVLGAEADWSFDERFLVFRIRNNLTSGLNRFLKRVFDLVAGAFILIAILPLLAVIALAIKCDSSGPVLFGHRRLGLGGREFTCWKFRTMHVHAEEILQKLLASDPALRAEWERDFKLRNDPRVTRVGRLLRRTSLDELPQIFNVLKGEMSLVGPRPRPLYEGQRRDPAGLFDVGLRTRPGITGLWQVSGRSELAFAERIQLEAWYVRNWSLWLDITILLRTVPVLLGRRGAY